MFSLTFLTFLTSSLPKAVFSLTFLTFLTFGRPFATWGAGTQALPSRIAQRPPNVKNVNENTAFWRFDVKNVKNVNENTAFWQVEYEMYWFSLLLLDLALWLASGPNCTKTSECQKCQKCQ